MQIRFLPEADAELSAARVWYRHQRSGLDADLMLRIDQTLNGSATLRIDFHTCISD